MHTKQPAVMVITRALPGALLTYHILEEWCEELVKLQMRGWQNKGYAAKKKKDDNLHGI